MRDGRRGAERDAVGNAVVLSVASRGVRLSARARAEVVDWARPLRSTAIGDSYDLGGSHSMPTVQSNGIEIVYEERGEGEPLVLIAGIGMQLVSWPSTFLEKLAGRGFRVIVFDNRDVGLSTK